MILNRLDLKKSKDRHGLFHVFFCCFFFPQKWRLTFDSDCSQDNVTIKILKIGTPKIITVIVLQMEQLDFTVQYCVQKMQTEKQSRP